MDQTKQSHTDSSLRLPDSDPIPCIRPFFDVDESLLKSVEGLLDCGRVSNNGEQVQNFERLLAQYLRVAETVAVSSGADALLLAIKALVLSPGRAVLPAYTYVATLNAVVHAGLRPVFCEIEPNSFTLDAEHLRELLVRYPDVRCVVPVNVFGVHPDLNSIQALCSQRGIKVLYDNAHGFGSEIDGHRVPRQPHAQVFSLHATKTLPAVEGGLIVSEDPILLSKVKRLRNHGLGSAPAEMIPGFNAKMDEIRAVIGIHSLRHFKESLERRRRYGQRLTTAFGKFSKVYVPQVIPEGLNTNYQNLGVCCLPAAQVGLKKVLELFHTRGIGVRSYFDPPLYKFPGFNTGPELPVTERIWRTLISVPIHSRMSDSMLERIEEAAGQVAAEFS